MIKKTLFGLTLVLGAALHAQEFFYFVPPKDWKPVDAKNLASSVKISFVSPQTNTFPPSINIATEKTYLPIKDYLVAVRSIHLKEREQTWREIGKIRTQAGIAYLTEISTKNEFGPIKMMQMILMDKGTAYVVTAAASQDEFAKYSQDFQKAFSSFSITSDLLSSISLEKKQTLQGLFTKKPSFSEMESFLNEHFSEMGPYWAALLIQTLQPEIKDEKTH